MAKIDDIIIETVNLDKQIKELTNKYNTNRTKLQKYFDDKDISELMVRDESSISKEIYSVKKIERVYIDYDPAKLKKKLSKDVYDEVTTKEYTINNIRGLIKLLRSVGIKPKQFTKYLDVTIKVDKEKIKNLFSVGIITQDDIAGCFDAKVVKSIQIREKAGDKY